MSKTERDEITRTLPTRYEIPFLDLTPEIERIKTCLNSAISEVLMSGSFILDARLAKFESSFANFCGTNHAIGVGNGLDAIVLSLQALGIGQGDEVIVPAHTFVATWLAVKRVGAIPVPCEIGKYSPNIDAEVVAPLIGPKTKAIIVVHLYGLPADIVPLKQLCHAEGLILIEDAAQAHGSLVQGQRCGGLGDAGCFSFYPTKNIGALGDAGAVVTNHHIIAERLRLLRNYGKPSKQETTAIGLNSRLDELQASILSVKLNHFDWIKAERRRIFNTYNKFLVELPELKIPLELPGTYAVPHLYVVQTRKRNLLRDRLKQSGIQTELHYQKPVYRHDVFKEFGPLHRTESDQLCDEILSLPIWPGMADLMVENVCEVIRTFFEEDQSKL